MVRLLACALLGLHFLTRSFVCAEATTVLLEKPIIPPGWKLVAQDVPQGKDWALSLSIALQQPALDSLRSRMLQSVALDRRPLSRDELKAYRMPAAAAVSRVLTWLKDNGVENARQVGAWIQIDATPAQVKKLFEADLSLYAFEDQSPLARARSYTVPTSLRPFINYVHPLAHFLPPVHSGPRELDDKLASRREIPDVPLYTGPCNDSVIPSCLREMYNWTYTPATAGPSPSRFAIAGFLEQWIVYQDVQDFMSKYTPELLRYNPPYNFSIELVAGGENPQNLNRAGMEAVLDVEWAMALAYPTQITYYSTGGRGVKLGPDGQPLPVTDNEPYINLLTYLLDLPDDKFPQTLSISYADDEQSVPQAYAVRVCDLMMQLAARGMTILTASGDGGARGIGRMLCKSNDGANRRTFLPTFPATCPWVTAVGATHNSPPTVAGSYSTGGFSDYFSRPAFQDAAVQGYITFLNGSKAGYYNGTGRAIPDISAVGTAFNVQWRGRESSLLGTSASTPVIASLVALANDARLRAGKAPMGWLTPVLYGDKLKALLSDIVDGESDPCYFDELWNDGEPGWPAALGWDAIVGLGVPSRMPAILEALVQA